MKVSLLYLYIVTPGNRSSCSKNNYIEAARKFASTYKAFPAGYNHELNVVCCNGGKDGIVETIFDGIPCIYHQYDGPGLDIGTHHYMASVLKCDFMVCMSSMTYFKKDGWLEWLMSAREMYGDGLYGSMGSFQGCPFMPWNKPNAHIRTCFYALSPSLMKAYPHKIESKDDSFAFESGPQSITVIAASKSMPVMMVTWKGTYSKDRWREGDNTYCRGDQSELISFDRMTDIFDTSGHEMRDRLTAQADGK